MNSTFGGGEPGDILTPSRDAAPRQWILASTPVHDWGGLKADPADEFEHRNGFLKGLLGADGVLVVIDRFRVREFAPSGRELSRAGRPGSGPSEFRGLSTICRFSSAAVAVYDPPNARLSIVAPGGNIVSNALLGGGGVLLDSPCLGDESVVVQRGNGSLARLDRNGRVLSELGSAPLARDTDGIATSAFVVAYAGKLYTATSNVPGYRVRSLDGSTAITIRFDEIPPPDTGSGTGNNSRFDSPNPSRRAEVGAEVRRAEREDGDHRFFDRIIVDESGVWLRTPRPVRNYGAPEVWTLFSHQNELVGQLSIVPPPYDDTPRDAQGRPPAPPFRPILMQGSDSTVLLLRYDDDGAAHFSEYLLVERSPP